MRSVSRVAAEVRSGGTILTELRSEPPLTIRPTRDGIALVGSAAAPVGGDESTLELDVGDGAELFVEAVAATIVYPSRDGRPSRQTISIRVGERGHLHWSSQPVISVRRSHHIQRVTIELASTATLRYDDWLALGRCGEPSGVVDTELRVTRGGRPLLHQRQIIDPLDPGSQTTAGHGGFDQIRQLVLVGGDAGESKAVVAEHDAEMRTPLADDAELTLSLSRRPSPPAVEQTVPMSEDDRPSVLFMCVHNAGRSQMAAGWLRHLAGDSVVVYSGGSNPAAESNPAAVEAMAEVGIDISSYQPQLWTDEIVRVCDVVVSMGCGDVCPHYPGTRHEDWPLTDPAGQGLDLVRGVRDEIRVRVEELLESLGPA